MSHNRTIYRKAFLESMRQARHYKTRIPQIAMGLQINALGALDQIRADERGMLMPDHTPDQVLRALNWKACQHHMGNNPFNIVRLPERLKRENIYPRRTP